jgi:hypothetical protein
VNKKELKDFKGIDIKALAIAIATLDTCESVVCEDFSLTWAQELIDAEIEDIDEDTLSLADSIEDLAKMNPSNDSLVELAKLSKVYALVDVGELDKKEAIKLVGVETLKEIETFMAKLATEVSKKLEAISDKLFEQNL